MRVQVTQHNDGVAFLSVVTGGLATVIAAIVTGKVMDAPAAVEWTVVAGELLASASLYRVAFGRWTRQQRRHVENVAARLAEIVGEKSTVAESNFAQQSESEAVVPPVTVLPRPADEPETLTVRRSC